MSKKQTSTTTKQYDPASMGAYQSLQGPAVGTTMDLMQHPYSSAFFQASQGMGQRAIGTQAGAAQQRLGQMGAALGTRGPVLGSMGDAGQRFGMSQGAQLGSNLILNAASMRQRALQDAMNYRPLQTGGTESQTTSGLGTWLPQVISMATSAATAGMVNPKMKSRAPTDGSTSDPWALSGTTPSYYGNSGGPQMGDPWKNSGTSNPFLS